MSPVAGLLFGEGEEEGDITWDTHLLQANNGCNKTVEAFYRFEGYHDSTMGTCGGVDDLKAPASNRDVAEGSNARPVERAILSFHTSLSGTA